MPVLFSHLRMCATLGQGASAGCMSGASVTRSVLVICPDCEGTMVMEQSYKPGRSSSTRLDCATVPQLWATTDFDQHCIPNPKYSPDRAYTLTNSDRMQHKVVLQTRQHAAASTMCPVLPDIAPMLSHYRNNNKHACIVQPSCHSSCSWIEFITLLCSRYLPTCKGFTEQNCCCCWACTTQHLVITNASFSALALRHWASPLFCLLDSHSSQ
jgi:hypothetical protein